MSHIECSATFQLALKADRIIFLTLLLHFSDRVAPSTLTLPDTTFTFLLGHLTFCHRSFTPQTLDTYHVPGLLLGTVTSK